MSLKVFSYKFSVCKLMVYEQCRLKLRLGFAVVLAVRCHSLASFFFFHSRTTYRRFYSRWNNIAKKQTRPKYSQSSCLSCRPHASDHSTVCPVLSAERLQVTTTDIQQIKTFYHISSFLSLNQVTILLVWLSIAQNKLIFLDILFRFIPKSRFSHWG